jgi:galactokinase/mevalonate kinase-like predicted kinase
LVSGGSKDGYRLSAKGEVSETETVNALKKSELVEKKNREIEESMQRERQSMSDVVYNYSKYRSMEHQYKWSEKSRKKVEKRLSNDKLEEAVKLPQVKKKQQ